MQNPPGTFIVLEGADGSGKTTQFKLLRERLQAVGYEVEVFDFPRYDKESSYFIKRYLNGDYGPAVKVSPYTASLFYALDRYEAASSIRKALSGGKIVLSDRFVGSNMAHQGSKFTDPIEQRSFFVWEDSLEFQLLNIPRPTLNIFLRVPADVSYGLISGRGTRTYTSKSHDEHEGDIEHLRKSVATYDLLCQLFPNDFKAVECTQNGRLMDIPAINNRIWQLIKPFLPDKPSMPGHSVVVNLDEKPTGPKDKKTGSKGFSGTKRLSLLAINELMSLGVSGQFSYSWAKAKYDFYIPDGLPKKTRQKYEELMGEVVELHKSMQKKLVKAKAPPALALPATPLAARVDFSFELSDKEAAHLVGRLSRSIHQESVRLAAELRSYATGGVAPDNSDAPQTAPPEKVNNILARIAEEHLPKGLAAAAEPVELLEALPRNEFGSLADSIYPYSNLSREEIQIEIDNWNYQQKSDALSAALSSSVETIGNQLHYKFDITTDQLLLSLIRRSGLAEDIKIQPPTPRYGYEVPKEVEDTAIADEFMACFDKSLEIYSTLQAAEREDAAPYATLLGHKNRLQLYTSYARLNRTGTKNLGQIGQLIVEKISAAHPIVGNSLQKQPQAVEPKATAKKSRRRHRSGKPKKS